MTKKVYLLKGALEARGLVVNIEDEVIDNDEEFQADEIVRQSVEPGESLIKGASISLYVARVGIPYPDFTDGTYAVSDVEDFCAENNLKLEITETVSENNLDGTIYRQSRNAGTPVQGGASFRIWVYVSQSSDASPDDDCDGLC